MYKVTFILPNGARETVEAEEGQNLLSVAHKNRIPLEGACEGALACSTCHIIVREGWFEKVQAAQGEASDAEEDMLDFAFGLTHTSRLGCQIKMCAKLDGIVVELPKATRNVQVEKLGG